MLSNLLLAAVSLVPGVLSTPAQLIRTGGALDPRQWGGGGYYWSFWQEGSGSHQCNSGSGGSYTATWSGGGGFVCGKGWSPGGERVVNYSGTYEPTGPSYLAVYGWTRNPLIEYYVVESHGDLSPGEPWTSQGNFTSEEGSYEVFTSTRTNKPSIEGTRTFQQYWSVRSETRTNGTVTMARHFDEWQALGLPLGTHDYMIMATEGYTSNDGVTSSGTAEINLT